MICDNEFGEELMDKTSWEQKLHALTHILTTPTNSPLLHSQQSIATQIPCYLTWDYKLLLCRRLASPLLILAKGVAEAQWGPEERTRYVRFRFKRKRGFVLLNPMLCGNKPHTILNIQTILAKYVCVVFELQRWCWWISISKYLITSSPIN